MITPILEPVVPYKLRGINIKSVSELLDDLEQPIKHTPKARKMEKINSQELSDVEVAKLWRGLDAVNEAMHQLEGCNNWMKKGEQAQVVLGEMRDLLSCLTHAVHKLKNDNAFIKRQLGGSNE